MRLILLLLFFFPMFAFAQADTTVRSDCKLKETIDPFTKQKTLSTGFIPMKGGSLTIDASKTEIDMLFSVNGADKCFTDQSTATIFFAGTKLKQSQRNNGSMNCEGLFHFIFRNGTVAPAFLRKLSVQKVDKIIFTGNNKTETIVTLSPDQQQVLQDLAGCMLQEAAGLLK